MKKLIGTLSAILIFSCGVYALEKGPAPDFNLSDLNGVKTTLSSQKGKVVFLDFWASWCPPCRASIPEVEKLYEKYKGRNIAFFGINVENDADAAKKFATKQGFQYPILIGDNKVSNDYEIRGIPAFYIIDQQGDIAGHYVGYSYGTADDWMGKIDTLLAAAPKSPGKKK